MEEIPAEILSPNVPKERDKPQERTNAPHSSDPEETDRPPGPRTERIWVPKSRISRSGRLAVGVSVVAMRGRVGSQRNGLTDLRLDSCADITLILAEFFATLRDKPAVQQGMRMKLWQLTDKDCELGGFIRIPVFVDTEDGNILEMEAEAYIVPKMTVPILLGEDFQLTYEISVSRSVENGTSITFRRSPHQVSAQPVAQSYDFQRLRDWFSCPE